MSGVDQFIERLKRCADRFAWTDSERDGIRGYSDGLEFCPVTAVVFAETGAAHQPEDAFELQREANLDEADVNLVVHAADNFHVAGAHEKYPGQDEVRRRLILAVGLTFQSK